MEQPADVFTRQVLDRIAARPASAQNRLDLWRPLVALSLTAAVAGLLPHAALGGLADLGTMARALPDWLLTLGRALPDQALSLWHSGQALPSLPIWLWGVLPAAGLLNGLFLARAAQLRRRSLS